MTFHKGWLFIEDESGAGYVELFNHARTSAYLQASPILGCGSVYGVLDDGGCPAFKWIPPREGTFDVYLTDEFGDVLTDGFGDPILAEEDVVQTLADGWTQTMFFSPEIDDAPWYNSDFEESSEALGFWVTEWTGLDSGHIQRQVTQVGAYGGGGVLGAMGSNAREMGFEVILIGESERALDYLFRWLDATLASVCVTCASDSILIRRFCPNLEDPYDEQLQSQEGVVEMHGVGLTSGLQWGAPPVSQGGCFMRRVNFTLAAQDPCMYGVCETVPQEQPLSWADCFTDISVSRDPCRPTCVDVDPDCRLAFTYGVSDPSAVAPTITLETSGHPDGSIPVRIRTYANHFGLTPAEICGSPVLGELYVSSLPPYTEFIYDVARRQVQMINASTGGLISAFAYLEPNDSGTPRFFSLGCGEFMTIIEPADWCVAVAPNVGRNFTSVTMTTRPRMGCA